MFDPAMQRVFIVEDNELMLRLYRSVFDSLGCSAGYATRGEEALRLLAHRRPDLIIMDDILPDAAGADLTRKLRSSPGFGDVPILAVGSSPTAARRDAMCAAGCTEFIAKPIQVEEFTALARRYLLKAGEGQSRSGVTAAQTAQPAQAAPDPARAARPAVATRPAVWAPRAGVAMLQGATAARASGT